MIDLLSMTHLVLREAGFTTSTATVETFSGVCFEDEAVVGFGCVFKDAIDMLNSWNRIETAFLTRHSQTLRGAGEKAWNVYLLLLTAQSEEASLARQVRWIEEDLDRTRKIAACGVTTREDVVNALLPLLPLQYQPALATENLAERLKRRIEFIAPRTTEIALDTAIEPAEVVRLLGEKS
jgi:hypothetical protein